MSPVAIVTGYTSGLGHEVAHLLLESNYIVVGVARRSRPADLCARFGDALVEVVGGVSADGVVEQAFARAQEQGGAELVVNCAGWGAYGPPGSYSPSEIRETIDANLTGLAIFSDAAVAHFGLGGGDIVNIMSLASKQPYPEHTMYIAAKAGAKAYSRALREDLQRTGSATRVIEVYPCGMNTDFFASAARATADRTVFYPPMLFARHLVDQLVPRRDTYPQEITYNFDRSRPVQTPDEVFLG